MTDRRTDRQTGELTGYPSIDKPWLKYYLEKDINEPIPKNTVYQSVYENNREYLEDIAINYYGNRICYKELFNRVDECTRALKKVGITRGDCVTLCTAGVPEAIYIVLACSRIGAIANFINPLFDRTQMVDRINDTKGEWIFVLDEMYHYIENILDRLCVNNIVIIPVTNSISPIASKFLYLKSKARTIVNKNIYSKRIFLYNSFVKSGQQYDGKLDEEYVDDAPIVMVYSSGTTGASKGILLTNNSINAILQHFKKDTIFGKRTETFLSMIPVWFSTGIVLSVIMPLAHGVCVIPEPVFSKESFAKDLLKYKPTLTLTATSLWLYVAGAEETKNIDLSNMIYPSTGGEKISEKDERMLNSFLMEHGCKVRLQKGYGMCELGSEVTGTTPSDGYVSKVGSVGYPILNCIVGAFDIETDLELPYGKHGEIRACTPARMKEYFNNTEATNEFFKTDHEGRVWGCTGDIGYVDEDGEVYILGRATDSFRRENGETVYLFDIEKEILKDESVNQCKVIDISEGVKTKLVAHIVFENREKANKDKIQEIASMLSDKLPDYMQPDYYKIRTSMPVHTNGKRDIEALRADREDFIAKSALLVPNWKM